MLVALPFAALLGSIFGSFLNVVAWRLPRGESLAFPASHCTSCSTPIRPSDNLPVLGWLLLKGRCRSCADPISARYPIVEAATAVLYVAVVAAHWGDVPRIALGIALVTLLVPMTLIDLDFKLIPDRLTGPFAVLAIALGAVLDPSGLPEQLIAAAAAGGFFLLAYVAKPGGMGFGDVKLAAVLGLYLGAAVAPAVFIALFAGIAVGAAVMRRMGVAGGRKHKIPFGPFLALGAVVALFAGDPLVALYLSTF